MNAPSYRTPPSVVAQVVSLPSLPMPEIKAVWQQLFGSAPTTHNRQFLERRLAYRLQEDAFRKVDPGLLERNRRRLDALVVTGKNQRRDRDYRPVAGTVLTREYRGVVHRVVATPDGQYDFEGRSGRSSGLGLLHSRAIGGDTRSLRAVICVHYPCVPSRNRCPSPSASSSSPRCSWFAEECATKRTVAPDGCAL